MAVTRCRGALSRTGGRESVWGRRLLCMPPLHLSPLCWPYRLAVRNISGGLARPDGLTWVLRVYICVLGMLCLERCCAGQNSPIQWRAALPPAPVRISCTAYFTACQEVVIHGQQCCPQQLLDSSQVHSAEFPWKKPPRQLDDPGIIRQPHTQGAVATHPIIILSPVCLCTGPLGRPPGPRPSAFLAAGYWDDANMRDQAGV